MNKYWLLFPIFVYACSGGSSPKPDTNRESFLGIDFKFPTNETMPCGWTKAFDGVHWPVISMLWHSPGVNYRCLDPFLADGRKKTVIVHLSNGVCRKEINNNCPPNEPDLNDIPDLALEAQQHIKALCPDCKVLLSLQLEDGLHPETFCKIAVLTKAKVPEAILVRNPLYADYASNGRKCYDYLELHATESAFFRDNSQCIWSNDGFDLKLGSTTWVHPNVWTIEEWEQHHRPGCINLLWTAAGNCLSDASYKAPFPADRQCWSDDVAISELNRLLLENQDEP